MAKAKLIQTNHNNSSSLISLTLNHKGYTRYTINFYSTVFLFSKQLYYCQVPCEVLGHRVEIGKPCLEGTHSRMKDTKCYDI